MRTVRITASARVMASALVLTAGLVGCGLNAPGQADPPRLMPIASGMPSALAIIVDPASAGAAAMTRTLLAATGRAGEHLFLLDMATGALLESASAPSAAPIRVPGPQGPVQNGGTSFQDARYRRALDGYKATVDRGRAELYRHEQRLLAAWAGSAGATVAHAGSFRVVSRDNGLSLALSTAAAAFSSLQETGVSLGARKVIVILDPHETSLMSASGLPSGSGLSSGLPGTTVVVAGLAGSSGDVAAWQASLLQAGASRAVILTPATSGQLAAVIQQGIDGAIIVPVTSLMFAPASYKLLKAANPTLHHVLSLLTRTYRQASATIDGYTDNLPVPGGNLKLSRDRADAVRAWLIAHGILASRLQANGYGDSDPAAPNQPVGQPRNRRVLVVIDPVVKAPEPA